MTKALALFDAIYQHIVDSSGVLERLPEDLDIIERLGRPSLDERVLDAGCGEGRITRGLVGRGISCDGADASAWMVKEARQRSLYSGVLANYWQDDFLEFRPRGRYDMILSWDTSFGFYSDIQNLQILKNFREILVAGGRLVMNVADYNTVVAQMPLEEEFSVAGRRVVYHHWINRERRCLETRREVDGSEYAYVSTRLYTQEELMSDLYRAGFAHIAFVDVSRASQRYQHYLVARS